MFFGHCLPQSPNFPSSTPPQTPPSSFVPMTFPFSVSLPFGRHFQAAEIPKQLSLASLLILVLGWCAHKLLVKYIYHLSVQVVVALGFRIVAWCLSGIKHDTWRIHSTLILPQTQLITTLDSKSGIHTFRYQCSI